MRPGEGQVGTDAAPFVIPGTSSPAAGPGSPVSDGTEDAGTSALPIPEAVRAAARRAPGHWIGVVDPEWTEARTPPEWAVLGEWQSDGSGSLGEYRANPEYRPSARVLGWPEPTDPVDAAAQRAATGYGSVEAALAALAEAEVTVVRGPDGGPLTAVGRDGAPVTLLFTSPAHEFMSAALHHDTVAARELARSLGGSGTMLMVNAGAAAPLLVPADSLPGPVRAADDERAPAEEAAAEEDPGAPAGAADRPGAPASTSSADRTDSSSDPWPLNSGRTP
ncbi:MAG TPA: type VII secretion system-associated protein [Streptomyces sp.]|uniref:type VII secretion system-associated protein n=1 Tax=Streptomyces sp. TaxID=1931 RepID=UPI002CF7BA24|nr:type VII secretion system-associated protein [Streptomyces sp.]HWU07833.1 type VII secretion system-associated protein [Streptomyces sp.]